jgi:hypothetical protein
MPRIPLVITLALLLGGCASYTATYPKITGPGSYMKTACGGPDERMVVRINKDLAIEASAVGRWSRKGSENEREFERVGFGFYVAPGHQLQMQPAEFELRPDDGQPVRVRLERIFFLFARLPDMRGAVSDPAVEPPVSGEMRKRVIQSRVVDGKTLANEQYSFEATAVFKGAPEHNVSWLQSDFQHFRFYATSAAVPSLRAKGITLVSPRLLLDGNPVSLPTFRIERVTESITGPVLC